MITPEEFPYIKSLYVNDCYAYKKFPIELHDYKPFSHLILTGKNGSGKSTILSAINRQFFIESTTKVTGVASVLTRDKDSVRVNETVFSNSTTIPQVVISFIIPHEIKRGSGGSRPMTPDEVLKTYRDKIYSYFPTKLSDIIDKVESPSKEAEFVGKLNSPDSRDFFRRKFKQYLVNQKVEQAFSQIENLTEKTEQVSQFFKILESAFGEVFDDNLIKIEFSRSNYEFYLNLSNGRKLTFEMLSDGFFAVLSILMDLFIRVDLIRKQVNDYSYNPCGIVLIDEPETHLHLQLQEQVLPLLTSLFPNIQFIAATHSPAVIASIKNATIFDLTTKESRISEETAGRSYSDLMRGHFGMNNEYSSIADELFQKVDQILKEYKNQPEELKVQLQQFFVENEAYFSPSFRVELESMILENA